MEEKQTQTSDSKRTLLIIIGVLGGCLVLCVISIIGVILLLSTFSAGVVSEFGEEFEKYEQDLREYEDSFRELNDSEDRELEVFKNTWPSDIPEFVPEFNYGELYTTGAINTTETWSIVFRDVQVGAFNSYKSDLLQNNWTIDTEFESQFLSATHPKGYVVQLVITEQSTVLSIRKSMN